MRTIKFRGKTQKGEWIEGDLCRRKPFTEIHHYIGNVRGNLELVIPQTVGQFTGLLDKNGKEIYEGDIVKVWHDREEEDDSFWTTGEVEYSPAEFYIRGDGHSITCHFHYNADERIIIGNIFDNPELIK